MQIQNLGRQKETTLVESVREDDEFSMTTGLGNRANLNHFSLDEKATEDDPALGF